MVLLPDGVVRTLYCTVMEPVKLPNIPPLFSKLTLDCTTATFAMAPRSALSVCVPLTELPSAAGAKLRMRPREARLRTLIICIHKPNRHIWRESLLFATLQTAQQDRGNRQTTYVVLPQSAALGTK